MDTGFKVITDYLHMCKDLPAEKDSEVAWDVDQMVPQVQEDIDFNSYFFSEVTTKEAERVCTFVTDTTEYLMNREDSSKKFFDMDQGDQVLYETIPDIKPIIGSSGEILQFGNGVFHENTTQDINPLFGNFGASIDLDEGLFLENESIQNMLVSSVKRDIYENSKTLNISSDPTLWSVSDVNRWIDWMCTKLQLVKPAIDYCQLDGAALCLLSETDFQWKCSANVSRLYDELYIWKNACKVQVSDLLPSINIPTPALMEGVHCDSSGYNDEFHAVPSISPAPSIDSSDSNSIPYHSAESDESFSCKNASRVHTSPPPRATVHEHKPTIHLWQFLKELLKQTDKFGHCIKWLNRSEGIFKIEDSTRVAKEWGKRKNRPAMNYDKLSRSIRQYYRKGIIKKTEHSKRLVYQFCAGYL